MDKFLLSMSPLMREGEYCFFAAPVRIVGPKMPGLLRREEHILSCDLMLV